VDRQVLAELLSWQLTNHCYGYCKDGKLRYKVDGCRMSGDMNTGIGNCILMCLMIRACMKSLGVPKYSLANNGDDCVLMFDRRYLPVVQRDLRPFFVNLGFSIICEEPVYEVEHIEFCQQHPVFDGSTWRMVRTVAVAMEKDTMSIKPLTNASCFAKWCNAIGDAGISLTGGIPVVQDFYQAMQRVKGARGKSRILRDPTFETGMMQLAVGMSRKYSPPHQNPEFHFGKHFE